MSSRRRKQGKPDFPGIRQHAPQSSNRPATANLNKIEQKSNKMHVLDCEEVGIHIKNKSSTLLPEKLKEGTLGKKIRLISNCYPLIIPDGFVYHYDVKIRKSGNSESTELDDSSDTDSSSDPDSESETNSINGANEVSAVVRKQKKKRKKYSCLSTKRNRQVINTMLSVYDVFKTSYAVYDGRSNLYTRYPLKIGKQFECEVVARNEDIFDPNDSQYPKMEYYQVTLRPIIKKETNDHVISLDALHAMFASKGDSKYAPEEAIMALETILRNYPCMQYIPIGRSFFYPPSPNDLHPLSGGREIWFGYHQSVRLGQWSPMVNLDITATPFYGKRPLLNYVAEALGSDVEGLHHIGGVEERDIYKMNQELKNLRIEATHLKGYRRRYHIQELTAESANNLKFTKYENGKKITMTVNQYFRQRLRFPHLPCVLVKSKFEKKEGPFFPIEVCEIMSQHCNKELTAKQSTEMIKFTAKPPRERFKEISEIFTNANYKNDTYLKEFEMDVLPEPIEVTARVLEAPSVRYDQDRVRPYNGSWNMKGKKFINKARVESWVLLSFASRCTVLTLQHFANSLYTMANKQGIKMEQPKHIQHVDATLPNVGIALQEMKQKHGVDLIVIVMPADKDMKKGDKEVNQKALYNAIKKAADTTFGLTTQCITADNVIKLVKKDDLSFLSNLCLKINAKMGGINHLLTPGEIPVILRDRPIIIIGADVNHAGPSADKIRKPSLAAVAGSLNSNASHYAVRIRGQFNENPNKQVDEIIKEFQIMVMDLLKAFYVHTRGQKPEKIIIYRDGVSEGQFKDVREKEVVSVRKACKALQNGYTPGITFIVVQKRHHVRFKPRDERDGAGGNHNIPPGTVIDTKVTHPLNADFFLSSHFGLKGTSKPGYYTVMEDDNGFNADQLQTLTYSLCYTFARCTRSISLPAPVQYAHLAAYRARLHLSSYEKEQSTGGDQTLPINISMAINVNDNLKDKMYFL